jgi:hypothetical protein
MLRTLFLSAEHARKTKPWIDWALQAEVLWRRTIRDRGCLLFDNGGPRVQGGSSRVGGVPRVIARHAIERLTAEKPRSLVWKSLTSFTSHTTTQSVPFFFFFLLSPPSCVRDTSIWSSPQPRHGTDHCKPHKPRPICLLCLELLQWNCCSN